MEPYWSDPNGHAPHSVKYESEAAVSSFPYCTESSLNFSTSATAYSEDDAEYATGRRNKTSRQDPLSHRIIEKRRRDRMNSCLADLSRLIPPQYQRKGRGRIEKTEIIEMAIRHLKHLQTECLQKENDYRLGYTECMKETAKFLYDSQMQEFCYRLLARLQEHCDELTKNDCYRTRGGCHAADNVSASSGSPHQPFHPAQPICQLRDMLNASDIEHSNDHNDVKDLSFRNHLNQLQRQNHAATSSNGPISASTAAAAAAAENHSSIIKSIVNNVAAASAAAVANCSNSSSGVTATSSSNTSAQPHQAAVITSTAPASLHHHNDSSNHDFDSSREPMLHTDTSNMHSPPPRDSMPYHHHHQHNNQHHLHHHHSVSESLLRMRNFSESSHDVEHNNNYKYKNHIKERFNHELHDEETSSEHCPAPSVLQSEHSHAHSLHSEHSKDGTEPEIAPIMAKKRKLAEAAAAAANCDNSVVSLDDSETRTLPLNRSSLLAAVAAAASRDEKPFAFSDIKTELNTSNSGSTGVLTAHTQKPLVSSSAPPPPPAHMRSFAVPIFALHGQGTYYVPLNVDYNALLPFLNGVDLLEKTYNSMPVLHPININVNFMPSNTNASLLAAAAAAAVASNKPVLNGNVSNAVTKAKLELTNGW